MDRREFSKRLVVGIAGVCVLGGLQRHRPKRRVSSHNYDYDGSDIWVTLPQHPGETKVTVQTVQYDRTRAISGVRIWDLDSETLVEEKRFREIVVVAGDSIRFTATYSA